MKSTTRSGTKQGAAAAREESETTERRPFRLMDEKWRRQRSKESAIERLDLVGTILTAALDNAALTMEESDGNEAARHIAEVTYWSLTTAVRRLREAGEEIIDLFEEEEEEEARHANPPTPSDRLAGVTG